jgi:TolA-binding protein
MKKLIILMLAALLLPHYAIAEDAAKTQIPAGDPFLKIKEAKNCPEAFKACQEAIAQCQNYDDYEKTASQLKDLAGRLKDYSCPSSLYYAIGKTRVEELTYLARTNDIESGRIYMSVNEKYFKEALENLDKAEELSKSKDMTLEIYLLKFMIFKELFQQDKVDAIFNEIVNKIASYTGDKTQNLAKLNEISKKLSDGGAADYAMRLKFVYASKVDPESSDMLAEDIKSSAEKYLEGGNIKEAMSTYDTYIQLADTCYDKDTVAAKIMDIAERLFEKKRYKDAAKYYTVYLSRYPASQASDYASYRLALSYYQDRDYANAISGFENFLKSYPNSVWCEKAFEQLCRIYYETADTDNAIKHLQKIIDDYPRRDTRDYACLLIAILYYSKPDYDKSLETLKKIQQDFPKSAYYSAVQSLIADINSIRKGEAPTYSFGSKEIYKVWEPYTSPAPSVDVSGAQKVDNKDAKPGETFVKAKPAASVKFTVIGFEDLDKFNEFQQDKEDQSRLPKEIRTGTEKDLVFLTWSAPDSGKFQDDKQSDSRSWQAPDAPGDYTITIDMGDVALVRPPDSGSRKDKVNPLTIHVAVEK